MGGGNASVQLALKEWQRVLPLADGITHQPERQADLIGRANARPDRLAAQGG